jgi:hypothetical protein
MPLQPARKVALDPPPSIERDFPPIRSAGIDIAVRVTARLAPDGVWRGRILFYAPELECATAEILCGATESDLWGSARALGPHHFRVLFESLT